MCIFIDILTLPICLDDCPDVFFGKLVLVLPVPVVTAGVNKQNVLVGLVAAEDENCRRDSRTEEELLRQADDRIEEVFIHELLADLAFTCAAKENAVRDDNAHASGLWLEYFNHVKDEGIVAFCFGR